MAVTIYKNVRFANRIDTPGKWAEARSDLAPGEIAFVGKDRNYYMVVGCDGCTNMAEILNDLDGHASHIFYPGPGGSGGGDGGSIPPATASTIGGVIVANEQKSGLLISEKGELTNALVDGYDYQNDRFIIDKLHVNNLSFDEQTENVSATGNYITVRADVDAGLGASEEAGLIVHNINGYDTDGFLGINYNNQIVIHDISQDTRVTGVIVAVNPDGGTGFINAQPGAPYANIIPFESLSFVENGKTIDEYTYAPNKPGISIDLTPPVIKVNGQAIYAENREYNISLDGGLTPENAEKLEQFDSYTNIIKDLNKKHINAVEGDGTNISVKMTANGELGQKIKVTHKNITPAESSDDDTYNIRSSGDQKLERITVVTGISLDSQGHVTGIATKNIAWVI